MSETTLDAAERETLAGAAQPTAKDAFLDRSVLALVRTNWETLAWTVLFVVGAVMRFYNLGVRAMSHDESLHALYSYYLYNAGNYEHNPMMHGPLLFHMNTLAYFLFGDSDAVARIVPALFGLGVMGMALAFRRYIGRTGALVTGVLVTISPSLLFHSRYIRNDIYIAFLTMVWIYGAMRYMDGGTHSGNPRRMRWLTVMVLGMAVGFISKENHFMHGALLGAFFAALALFQVLGTRVFLAAAAFLLGSALGFWLFEEGFTTYALLAIGVAVAAAVALLALWLARHGWAALRRNDAADLAILMATLVLPFTAPFGHLAFGWDAMAYATQTDLLRSAGLVAFMTLISILLAYFWFGRRGQDDRAQGTLTFGGWAQMMGLFWLIQVLFFTTFLTNTRNGLATGIVGSLGYWLAQQEVARGGQPWYYYIMIGWLYEFLPMLLTFGGFAAALTGMLRQPEWDPVPRGDLPESVIQLEDSGEETPGFLRRNRVYFIALAGWWTVGAWMAYTVAGEKMPWLLVHLALPMCVMGGWWLGRVIRHIPWGRARETGAVWIIGAVPALTVLVVSLVAGRPRGGRALDAVANTTQWLLGIGLLAGLGYLVWRWSQQVGRSVALRLAVLGLALVLLLGAIRFTYLLNYVNYDLVTEYLVYAHASPDIKRALDEIDRISERTVGGRNIVVAYDDESSWPLSWYMRQYPNAKFYGSAPNADAMAAPVIIVGPKNYDKVHPYVTRDYVKRTYRLVWWPDQGYFNLTPQRFIETLRDPARMRRILDIVLFRRYADDADPTQPRDLTEWPNRHNFEMWVHRDLADQIWDLNVTPLVSFTDVQEELVRMRAVEQTAVSSYSGQFGSLPLLTPRAVAVGPDGRRVIADTGNNRIVVLDAGGTFVREFGTLCRLGEGEAGGCVDPDGSGPLVLGDGQFNEPWGVAVDEEGQIFVADTWNGRIQVFDQDGTFLRKWGYFNTTNGELGDPLSLFGPRGLEVDLEGNLLVADTGNKRILLFTPEGELLHQIGGGGVALGRFEEPTDTAVDPRDGSIYVADLWNQRIQKLDPTLQPLAEWPVPSWGSEHLYHKAALTVAGNGDIYASDPANFRVLVYNDAGSLKAAFGSFGPEMNRFALPTGVDWDSGSATVLVADSDNHRIQVVPALP